MRTLVDGQWRAEDCQCLSDGEIAGCVAIPTRIDGLKRRLRRGRMRFVLGIDGWRAGEQLSDTDPSGQGCRYCYHRGTGCKRDVTSAARGLSAMRRRAVWYLHAGNDSRGFASSQEET